MPAVGLLQNPLILNQSSLAGLYFVLELASFVAPYVFIRLFDTIRYGLCQRHAELFSDMTTRSTVTAKQWEDIKPKFLYLYHDENKSLAEVRQQLEAKYGFKARLGFSMSLTD